MPEIDDFEFLVELARQRDTAPGDDTTGTTIAEALGQPGADTEPNVRRLLERGDIDWAPGPHRLGDGWNRALVLTPAGYGKAVR